MTTRPEIVPGSEIKLGAHYKARSEGDIADTFIVIKSLDTLFDETATKWGETTVSDFRESLKQMPEQQRTRSLETVDEWLLIARERFVAGNAPPEDQEAFHVKVAMHTFQLAVTNGFERLKTQATESLTRAIGARKAKRVIKDLQEVR